LPAQARKSDTWARRLRDAVCSAELLNSLNVLLWDGPVSCTPSILTWDHWCFGRHESVRARIAELFTCGRAPQLFVGTKRFRLVKYL